MEYNYTREWKQPHKIYNLGPINVSRFFPEGLKLSFIVGVASIIGAVLAAWLLAAVLGITFLSNLFRQSWMIIIFLFVVALWILFSLSWDKKGFFRFVSGRYIASKHKGIQTEHTHKVCFMNTPISFNDQKKKGRVLQWRPK